MERLQLINSIVDLDNLIDSMLSSERFESMYDGNAKEIASAYILGTLNSLSTLGIISEKEERDASSRSRAINNKL